MHTMLNPMKNYFPVNPNAGSALKAGEGIFFKYKQSLLVLFFLALLVLVVGVFSLPANQKGNVEKEKDPPASVSKDKVTKPEYVDDAEYLALPRYERFSQIEKKPVQNHRQKVRDTVIRSDKPLTLGGRGLDFKGRQPGSKQNRLADFTHRLKKPVPKMEPVSKDNLDLQLHQVKGVKSLIFHPIRQALGQYNRQKIYIKDEQPEERKPQILDDIPETRLLLMEEDNSFLVLRRSTDSLDLLSGHEKVNRREYFRR
jgi:hypothetical protein